MHVEDEFTAIGQLNYNMENQESLNITGTVVHNNDTIVVDRFDQSVQKKNEIRERSFVVADTTGAVFVYV
jgi:hypothetical protein